MLVNVKHIFNIQFKVQNWAMGWLLLSASFHNEKTELRKSHLYKDTSIETGEPDLNTVIHYSLHVVLFQYNSKCIKWIKANVVLLYKECSQHVETENSKEPMLHYSGEHKLLSSHTD